MIGGVILLVLAGLPVTFALGFVGIATLFGYAGTAGLYLAVLQIWGLFESFIYVAIPLFVMMGAVLARSGVADDLFQTIYKLAGRLNGGLAMGTVLICTLFAAMEGTTAAATLTMGLIALPAMLKRGYSKELATGCIQAGGALGFLIPPSILMILYCSLVNVSVGKMFVGGVFPGIMLAFMFIVYIGVRSALQPGLAPPIPPEERVGLRGKVVSLKSVILPVLLIMSVMGSLFAGITTPTEAAAIGCAGAFITAMVKRSFSWSLVKDSVHTTVRLVGIVAWIIVSAYIFNIAFSYIGGKALISSWVTGLDVAPMVVIVIIQLSLFLMGTFLDDVAIMFLTVPIYVPVIQSLGFSSLWFGVLLMVNLQMAYLTPPFGGQLFIMKAIAPKEVTMAHIYRSVIPFVIIQGIAVVIIMFFPQIVLWLPTKLFG